MKTEYTLAFLGGIELMAFANAFSLGLLPCRVLAVVFLLAALAAVGVTGFFLGRRSCRNAVNRRSYTDGIWKGIDIGRAERQSEIQMFLEK